MIADLVFLGFGLRIIVGAVGRGRQQRQPQDTREDSHRGAEGPADHAVHGG